MIIKGCLSRTGRRLNQQVKDSQVLKDSRLPPPNVVDAPHQPWVTPEIYWRFDYDCYVITARVTYTKRSFWIHLRLNTSVFPEFFFPAPKWQVYLLSKSRLRDDKFSVHHCCLRIGMHIPPNSVCLWFTRLRRELLAYASTNPDRTAAPGQAGDWDWRSELLLRN